MTHAGWSGDGVLELRGTLTAVDRSFALVLRDPDRGDEHSFATQGGLGRFTSRLTPARIDSIGGTPPLRDRHWRL